MPFVYGFIEILLNDEFYGVYEHFKIFRTTKSVSITKFQIMIRLFLI